MFEFKALFPAPDTLQHYRESSLAAERPAWLASLGMSSVSLRGRARDDHVEWSSRTRISPLEEAHHVAETDTAPDLWGKVLDE